MRVGFRLRSTLVILFMLLWFSYSQCPFLSSLLPLFLPKHVFSLDLVFGFYYRHICPVLNHFTIIFYCNLIWLT
ncbi:hypothetical protein GIB67_007660 [Kingdonia uniflora]|uniref:Uncharacterized protein n=1 Tax=Kingdonia uniflora TaxID=39325 RepID=A0A7J7N1F0_9MAGN|nr:hypothetical protein GIB67_007660 [Kingdonia uniflora]